jgi:hypothetical protein
MLCVNSGTDALLRKKLEEFNAAVGSYNQSMKSFRQTIEAVAGGTVLASASIF